MIVIDAKKLLCPLPVIRLGEAMNKASMGDKIKIIASDHGVLHDIPAWCKVHGHKVLSIEESGAEIIIISEKVS